MSKTNLTKLFDRSKAQKQERRASVRFKTEKKRRDDKRFYAFSTWLERTAPKD